MGYTVGKGWEPLVHQRNSVCGLSFTKIAPYKFDMLDQNKIQEEKEIRRNKFSVQTAVAAVCR